MPVLDSLIPEGAMAKSRRVGSASHELIGACLHAGRLKVVCVSVGLIIVIAALDWLVDRNVSLAALYVVPVMLAAVVLRPVQIASVAFICASLRTAIDTPATETQAILRFAFAFPGYLSAGLFVIALSQNRELTLEHLSSLEREQARRRVAEEQLRRLVESSPAAIVTLDAEGVVIAANNAANRLFALPEPLNLQGQQIARYLPMLSEALLTPFGSGGIQTSAQCQGCRGTGELFLANTWFSSYATAEGPHLAAIVVDASDEMRDREEQNLRDLLTYNRITAAAISHEVRNACAAISLLSASLQARQQLAKDEDFLRLMALIEGLEKIASFQLRYQSRQTIERVPLQDVLDTLRIIVDADWREIGGTIRWPITATLPDVLADPHGLLQAFLNLVQNSRRAVQAGSSRELRISVSLAGPKVILRLEDSGPGVVSPGAALSTVPSWSGRRRPRSLHLTRPGAQLWRRPAPGDGHAFLFPD